jgi:hypothetical protein
VFFHVVLLACRGASPVFIGESIAASANKSRHPPKIPATMVYRFATMCFPLRLFGVASQTSKSWQCCSNQHRQIAAGTLLGESPAESEPRRRAAIGFGCDARLIGRFGHPFSFRTRLEKCRSDQFEKLVSEKAHPGQVHSHCSG